MSEMEVVWKKHSDNVVKASPSRCRCWEVAGWPFLMSGPTFFFHQEESSESHIASKTLALHSKDNYLLRG